MAKQELGTAVFTLVVLQVHSPGERLRTFITFEGLLPAVFKLVASQGPCL